MVQEAPRAVPPAAPPPTGPRPTTSTPTGPRTPDPKTAHEEEPSVAHHKASGPSHIVWVVLAIIIIAVTLGIIIYKNRKKAPVRMPPPITISTTNAVSGNIDETVERIGTVTPIYTAMISPRVDGQLVKVNYTEGQMVTTNDLLVEIDPAYQAMLTESQGQLARDQAMLQGAKIDLQRFEDAYGKAIGTNLHAIPKQQVDDQLALVHQDEGTVKYDEGQVANAKVQLAYCFIYAPFSGRAGLRLVDPGNVVHAANTNALVVVAELQPITVIFSPTEDELPALQRQLRLGHKMVAEAYDRDLKEKLATGEFLTMDNLIDVSTGTIRIKALFPNEELMLFPNQFVNIKLIIDTLTNVTLIPTPAIQRNPQGAFVYVVTNGMVNLTNKEGQVTRTNSQTVVMQPITTGVSGPDITSVNGLEPGTVIATDNFNKLGDGVKVNLRQPGGEGRRGGRRGGAGQRGGQGGGAKPDAKKNKAQDDES